MYITDSMARLIKRSDTEPDNIVALLDELSTPHGAAQEGDHAATASDANVPNPTVQSCSKVIKQLQSDKGGLSPKERLVLVAGSLDKLREDVTVSTADLCGIAYALHNHAPREYTLWTTTTMKAGMHFVLTTSTFSPRVIHNLLGLLRPPMIAEMKLVTISEVAQLDCALAALSQYNSIRLELTMAHGRHIMAQSYDGQKAPTSDAKLRTTAQAWLRLYLTTLERLQSRTATAARPALHIQHAAAVPLNVDGSLNADNASSTSPVSPTSPSSTSPTPSCPTEPRTGR